MALLGHHDTFKLQHGASVREFSDVEVSAVDDERYELTGIEHKVEVSPNAGPHVVDVEVTVGFLAANVINE